MVYKESVKLLSLKSKFDFARDKNFQTLSPDVLPLCCLECILEVVLKYVFWFLDQSA